MASATDWRRLLDTHLVLWCLNGGGVRQPGNVMRDGDQAVDRPAAGESAGTGAPDAVAGLPLAANQQRLLAAAALETDGVHRDPLDRLLVSQSRVEPGKVITSTGTWGLPAMAWLVQQLKQPL